MRGGSIVIFDYEYTKADTTLHLRDMRSGPSSAQQRTHSVVLGQVDRALTRGIRHLKERLGGSNGLTSATSEAASSRSQGSGWAPSGPASLLESAGPDAEPPGAP